VNAQIRRVGLALLVGFLAVFLQLNYVQIFAAEEIASNNANVRALLREYSIRRGRIVTLDGVEIAVSKRTRGKLKFLRTYPEGELYGHITGFYSLVYGESRIEASYDGQLLGESGVISMQDIEDRFLGSGERGDDVRLTIDSQLQELARDTLGSQEGAVVAMDPGTGEVRAMYATPSYDPTGLAVHEPDEIRRYWRSLDPRSPSSPLVSKETSLGYPAGSTFKVITAAAALESGEYTRNSTFPDPQALLPCAQSSPPCMPQTNQTLTNFTKTACTGGGSIDLFTALEISCDTTFAILGLRLHREVFEMAEALGFNEPLPFDVGTEASGFPFVEDDNQPFRAYQAIGQGDVSATPLQMAVVAATIANGGDVPQPQVVREIIDASGGVVRRSSPETIDRAMSGETARELTDMMIAVVESGTGTAAQIPGVEVAGKTGTAQTGTEGAAPHAWFIAFAPARNPELAVAVMVENGGTFGSEATGGQVAAPIARAIIEADRRIRGW
jgi:peptidoglycan glycosyltransferase